MTILRLAAWTLWFTLSWIALAHAGPVVGIFLAIGQAIAGLGVLGQFIVGIALKVGLSLLQKALQKKPKEPALQADISVGGDNPLSIVMGAFATAGQLEYVNFWGNVDKTPNAYITHVVSLSDLPLHALTGLWVNDQKVTLPTMTGTAPTAQGWPVAEFAQDGKDYLWIKFVDGSQTAADGFLTSTFGGDTDRPWQSDQIGRGVAYAIVTARRNDKLFSGIPSYLFETDGILLYDVRKDSTAGGSGSHRWNTPSTWEVSSNPVIHIYNVIRGVRYGSEWVYGGQTMEAYQLPAANWMAAANACDEVISLVGGGSEPRYRAGCQITVDQPPADAIESILKGCSGRVAEVGGAFKITVGAPGAAVYSFTDEQIIVTEAQSFDPFPGLEQTFNGAQASYPEPAEKWASKDAPAYLRSDLEVLDDNRRLVTGLTFPTVPYAIQVQRLLKEAVEDARRFKQHQFYLAPDAQILEPGDVVAWTSTRNSYSNKKFLVIEVADQPNMLVLVTLKEIDPSDFSWNPETDEHEYSVGPVGPIRPPVQAFAGWAVEQYTFTDAAGVARRPGILVKADGDLDDVEFVRVQVRRAGTTTVIYDQVYPYGNSATNTDPLLIPIEFSAILPSTAYEARGLLEPYSGRDTEWSDWLSVTTPDVRLGPDDFYPIDIDQLADDVQDLLASMQGDIATNEQAIIDEAAAQSVALDAERDDRLAMGTQQALDLRSLYDTVSSAALQISDLYLKTATDQVSMRQEIVVSTDASKAYSDDQLNLAVGPTSALAARLTTLQAEIDGVDTDLDAAITTLSEAITDAVSGEASARQALELQVRGTYTGSDITLVSEGLLYQERQTRIAEDAALSESISLVSAGVGILFDWLLDWSFNTSVDGWTGNGAPTQSGGWLRPANHATDPYVVSPDDLDADGDAYKQIKMRVRKTGSPTWEGQFWWQGGADSTWDAGRRASLAEPTYVDGVAVLTVDMTWSSTVDRIRVDLSSVQDASNYFEIDWIDIGRPSPGASRAQVAQVQQALTSALAAEASDREALSVILVGAADPTGLTIPTLTSGLVYDEKTARVDGDSALSVLITGVQSALDDQAGDIDALTTAQSTMQTSIDTLDDQVTLNASNIDDAVAELAGKASTDVTDELSAEIAAVGGGEVASQVGQALRDIRLQLDRVALGHFDLLANDQRQRLDLSGALVNLQQSLTGRIDTTDGSLSLLGQAVTAIQLALPGYATLNITDALTGRVTANEAGLVSTGSAITAIQAALAGYTASDAIASAFTATNATVSSQGGQITSLADLVNAVSVSVDDVSAGGKFRVSAQATSAGASATVGLIAEATAGATSHSAAILLDAMSDGTSRAILIADQVAVMTGSTVAALFEAGTTYIDNARIRNLDADNIRTKSLDAEMVMQDGTVITDLISYDSIIGNGVNSCDVNSGMSTSWVTYANINCPNPNPSFVLIDFELNAYVNNIISFPTPATTELRLVRDVGGVVTVLQSVVASRASTGSATGQTKGFMIDEGGARGSIYRLQGRGNYTTNQSQVDGIAKLIWWKR